MNTNWKQDPRLKKMNPQKLSLLTEFAKRVDNTPRNQLIPTLLNLNMEASQKGISFSDEETELLVSIMSSGMSPAERQKIETMRMLSKNLSKRK